MDVGIRATTSAFVPGSTVDVLRYAPTASRPPLPAPSAGDGPWWMRHSAAAALTAGVVLPAVAGVRRRRGKAARWRQCCQQKLPRAVSSLTSAAAAPDTQLWRSYGSKWEIHKFGGASLANAELYKTCGDLLISESQRAGGPDSRTPTAAIVSAMGGMTDALASVVTTAVNDLEEAEQKLKVAGGRQIATVLELVPDQPELTHPVIQNIMKDQDGVRAMLTSAAMMQGVPPQMMELVAGLGEVWSAQTLAAYLQFAGAQADWVDARETLIVADTGVSGLGEKGQATDIITPVWEETSDRLQAWWEKGFGKPTAGALAPFLVITGFVCRTSSGRPTTLKRSGSDYSATIFAKVLGGSRVTMWKNVNGVYTADPRAVPDAFSIPKMTFDEAMELAYFGGQVLHPSAMIPCIEERIPVLVRNVFNPSHPGTRVYGRGDEAFRWDDQDDDDGIKDKPVKAVTSIEKAALVTVSGASFIGTPGVAKRMMEALGAAGINVILTSQGSSEHSITVAVDENDGDAANAAVRGAFELELARNPETMVKVMRGTSILAVIGEGMKDSRGVAGRFFNALGRAKVSVIAIAQGSSERNISAVVERSDLSRALRAVHAGFTLSDTQIAVGIIGMGFVGTELVRQLARFDADEGRNMNLPAMRSVNRLKLVVRAACDVSTMMLAADGIPYQAVCGEDLSCDASAKTGVCDTSAWKELLADKGTSIEELQKEGGLLESVELKNTDLNAMIDFLDTKDTPHKVIIDCTAADAVASMYPEWLRRGLHVISPNKKAGSGPLARYNECLSSIGRQDSAQWHYEATVGGQMPVISLIGDLLQTGDKVTKLFGVFSGALSHIFNAMHLNPGMRLSEAVASAREMGLTEPNVQEDLSGEDTVRKSLILARELGLELEMEDVVVESLVPKSLRRAEPDKGSLRNDEASEEFIERLRQEVDEDMESRMRAAADKKERLYYLTTIDVEAGTVTVGLESFPIADPPFALRESDTAACFVTERYPSTTPLVVRGPGAGALVTASGIFQDLLRLSKSLGN